MPHRVHWDPAFSLFSSVESDKARQVREVIEDFGVISTTNLELRRSDQNRPETRTNAEVSLFAESSIAENRFSVGHEVIDAQHQSLLAQCVVLAGHCQSGEGEPGAQTFNPAFAQAFERLQALVREHFKTEASLLSACGQADLEDHQFECDEFEYLAGEIATQEHFDRLELQRFLALWCVGHVTGSAAQLRGLMASGGTPG